MVKKMLAVLLAMLMLCVFMPMMASADGVDITADFTDENFRAAVYEKIGKTAPVPIYDTDVAAIASLGVNGKDIKSLAGLEHFAGLKELFCGSNQLTSLPALPSGLERLGCSYNQLSSLPALPSSLEVLSCGDNPLNVLPALPSLINLSCHNNKLTVLPALPSSLKTLQCSGNQLISLPALPVSLEILVCDSNQLASLPALPSSLRELWCGYNQLTTIDVTGLPLEKLQCYLNNMTDPSDVIGFTGTWSDDWRADPFVFAPQNSTTTPEPEPDPGDEPTEPSFFAKLWSFILKWFLFGWIWMK